MNEMRLADFQILSRYFTMENPQRGDGWWERDRGRGKGIGRVS